MLDKDASQSPNFRIGVSFADEEGETITTLAKFLAENEGSPVVCDRVAALNPGEVVAVSEIMKVRRFEANKSQFSRFRVPIRFDGAEFATVTIDRKRLTLSIRPARRRSVFEMDLSDFAQRMLERQAKLNILARKKARKQVRRK